MTIKSINNRTSKIEIDLTGPEGNAYALLGYVKHLGRQLGYSADDRDIITKKMMSGDYENLLTVFDEYFGEIVDLYR